MLEIFCYKDLWFNNKHLLATIMWINNCSCINKYESLKCSKLSRKCKITTTCHLSPKFGNYSGYNKMLNVSSIFSFTSYIESYISYISFVLKTKSSEDICVCVYFFFLLNSLFVNWLDIHIEITKILTKFICRLDLSSCFDLMAI